MKLKFYPLQWRSITIPCQLLLLIAFSFSVQLSLVGQNCRKDINRTYNGSCNNTGIGTSDWGASEVSLLREVGFEYALTDPMNEMVKDRPNPRAISNAVFSQKGSIENTYGLSSFVFTWGQFLDHDIDLSDEGEEKIVVPLPADEPHFTSPIHFTRSKKHEGTGVIDPRTPSNSITAWIDGSQIYGSNEKRAKWLRTFQHGKLKMSKGRLLPYNTLTGEANGPIDPNAPIMANPNGSRNAQFVAGDVRAAEQPGLTLLHTVFVREHNRICEELVTRGYTNDEQNYQTARKRVGAMLQAITYNEFLPALGLHLNPYYTYNPSVKPNIMNEFSTAAYRIGHTMVTEELLLLKEDCSPLRAPVKLEEAFFNPTILSNYGIEPLIKGLANQLQQEVDAKVIDGLRNFLFNIPQSPKALGLDLATLNILRGRDHGLKDYNTIRAYFTGNRVYSFDQINSDPAVWKPLAEVYNHDINKVDAWVGMLAEEHYLNSTVGPTIYHIMKGQFERLRDGDRFYYLYDRHLSHQMKQQIKRTKLSDILLRNSSLNHLAKEVFKVKGGHCQGTPTQTVVACGNLSIAYGNGAITITGDAGKNYLFQVFNHSWKNVHSCYNFCGHTTSVANLKNGKYKILVYGSNYQRVCFKEIELGQPAIDADGDGVVASLDCDDRNPNLTRPGASCNDGNAATINDIITANCKCIGTPIDPGKETITCNDVTISYGKGTISFEGNSYKNYKYRVQRISYGDFIDNCFSNRCGYYKSYDNLPAGTYLVRIWSSNWKKLCYERITLKDNYFASTSSGSRTIPPSIFVNERETDYQSELYPNPAFSEAYLTLPDFVGKKGQVMIYNNLGQRVQSFALQNIAAEPISLELQSLEAGLYHVHAVIEDGIRVQHKLVIKR